MIARRELLGLLAGAVALLWGCDMKVEDMGYIWQEPHYAKLTAEVETPEGIKSGYSVLEVKWDKAGRGYNIRGEAVAVDLPKGETLFILLSSTSNVDWAAWLHQIVKLENSPEDQALYYSRIAANRQIWPVPRTKEYFGNKEVHDNYPYFVRFRDIKDPKSVEQVDPDDLAKTFGPGVKLKSLTVQMTDEPVTKGIEKRLPRSFWKNWGAIHKKEMDKGKIAENPYFDTLMGKLNAGDFRRGFKK